MALERITCILVAGQKKLPFKSLKKAMIDLRQLTLSPNLRIVDIMHPRPFFFVFFFFFFFVLQPPAVPPPRAPFIFLIGRMFTRNYIDICTVYICVWWGGICLHCLLWSA